MARCPHCKRTFRTLEDEEGMHDCPNCGHGPGDDLKALCILCEMVLDDDEFYPYCGPQCVAEAEADSQEDDDLD